MSRRPIQAERELYYLARFAELLVPAEAFLQSELLNPPEPDALLRLASGARVGVEITEINPSGQEARRRQGEQDKAIVEARRRYEAAGHPPVGVTLYLGSGSHWVSKERDRWAQALAEFVARTLPDAGTHATLTLDDSSAPLPEKVDGLRINREPYWGRLWHAPASSFPPFFTADMVQASIDAKDTKPGDYREKYDQCWLLIVAAAEGPPTWGLVPPELRSAHFGSAFDRVFLLVLGFECLELQVGQRSTAY